jgi:ParB/RepB/Spo0J family partition protein
MAELKVIKIEKIRIPDVRVSSMLDDEQRALLRSTIREIGVVQDIIVRGTPDGAYELVAGKSRLEALKAQGLTETQVKVIGADEKLALIMNITENVARGSFEYISIAQSIRKLRELGSSLEELEKIFPWRRRWIEFLEGLQDLPDDVIHFIKAGELTPTHVQVALNLPTPIEIHDGLRTAKNLGWDTGTFKIFVQNRVDQIARAKSEAEAKGGEAEIPAALPEELIKYKQCLVCGYKKPAETVTVQLICEPCVQLTKYITDQLGPAENAIQTVYQALQIYFGLRPAAQGVGTPTPPGSSPA